MSTASGLKNLFFVKRRPKLRLIFAPNWENPLPGKPTEWDKELAINNFIPISSTANKRIPPSIVADLEDLDTSGLLITFFKLDHRARFHQNLFYAYQWTFVLFAFLITLCSGYTVLSSSEAAGQSDNASSGMLNNAISTQDTELKSNASSNGIFLTSRLSAQRSGLVSGVLALCIGFISRSYSRYKPQKKWFTCRRQAENLRAEYFLFLAHTGVYKNTDRYTCLLKAVVDAEEFLQ